MTPYGTEEPSVNGGITSYLILHDYNPCVMYGGVLYSGNSDQVKINLSLNGDPVADYSTDHFIASAGTINSSTNPRTLTMPNEDVTISLAPTALNLYTGDLNDPFLIYTSEQWRQMCSHINNGESVPYIGGYYSEKYYKLMADITLTETHSSGNSEVMVGISSNDHTKFGGTFDGNGHTITLDITDNSSDNYCAPFRYLKDGTIKNLHVAGTIVKTDKKNAGGFVGKAEGNNSIRNCRSSVDIFFDDEGDCSSGGFVGELRDGNYNTTNFYNCLFDGTLRGSEAYRWGGFVGWVADDCLAHFSSCFFNPTNVNFDINDGDDNSKTFARFNSGDGTVIVNNCYYTTLIKDAQGSTDASGIDNEQLRFNLGHGWEIISENSVAKVVPIMKKYLLSGEGTEASPYLITSTDDWNGLAGNVYLGETYSGEFLQLTDNITVNRMIGTGTTSTLWDTYSFSGTFDGAGNTLTFDYSTNVGIEGLIAPFRFVDGATIKNLVVDGTIVAANKYAAGIIGRVDGNTALTNCRSSVTINSSVAGEGNHGGLIGLIRSGYSATITGCLFDGKLLGGSTTHCGGFVGLAFSDETDKATVNIINSLYAPAEPTGSETWINATGSHTLAHYITNNQVTITNSYYMQTLGTSQGKQARTISGSENIFVENAGTATEYDVSGFTNYGTGMGLTSMVLSEEEEEEVVVLYAGNGDHVSLSLTDTIAAGYARSSYVVSAGTLTGNDNDGYTLEMPDEDVTISATINVAEWEGNGSEEMPYLIYNSGQLDLLASRVNGESSTLYNNKYYKLMDDIVYDHNIINNYTAIGNNTRTFKGHFDGNDHAISGIRINSDNPYQGLFGYIGNGGEVKNATLIDTDITGRDYTSGIAGCNHCGTIDHCQVASSVYIRIATVGSYHGGIVGSNEGTDNDAAVIKNCVSSATLTTTTAGFNHFGGIAGNNGLGGRITDNLAIRAIGPDGIYGIITAVNQNGGLLERNYYVDCTVGEAENVIGKGCANGDIAENDSAVPGNARTIAGYGESETTEWAFIASPLTDDIDPTTVENLLIASEYDLYRLNPSTTMWENYKNEAHTDFVLENGQGYLYATQQEETFKFTGDYNLSDTVEVTLQAGFNLVGNPFPRAAYIGKAYYKLNNDGSSIVAEPVSTGTYISPCHGVVVEGTANETVTFSTTAPESGEAAANNGSLQIALSQANTRSNAMLDNAIVSFGEGEQLGKFYFGTQDANISLPQDGEDYAIASVGRDGVHTVSTEMPLNFKANENGTYTLTVNPEGVEMAYLHLIDNMTGADVDLLAATSTGSETFGFINASGNIIVNGEGTLQIVNMTGRVVVSRTGDAMNRVSTNGMAPGVYVLRLINGDDVKTQKIVVRR